MLSETIHQINNSTHSTLYEENKFPFQTKSPFDGIAIKIVTASNLESWFNQYSSKKLKVKMEEIKLTKNHLILNVYKNNSRKVKVSEIYKFAYQNITLKMNNTMHPCESLKINIINDKKKQKMMLPETLSLRLLNLFSEPRDRRLCCGDFVAILFNKFKKMNYFDINDWIVSKEYEAGDAVALRSSKLSNNFLLKYEHFAIYIGEDIYMSILGKGNCIHFTTLGEMKNLYDNAEVVGIKPLI